MNRRIVCLVAGLLALGGTGFMIARAQPTAGAVFIAGAAVQWLRDGITQFADFPTRD